MKKINILEVNNIDLAGRSFNGYDMISDLSSDKFNIKQMVIVKQSDNDRVIKLLNNPYLEGVYYKLIEYEEALSTINVFSITTPAFLDSKEYKEADIIHFHMFHNTRMSLYSLIDISKEKKVVITLHDPYFMTGHCVHFFDCNKWKDGCKKCNHLDYLFPCLKDNSNEMWKLKKYVFDNSNVDLVVSSQWMYDLVKESPIFKNVKNVHLIPFGVDINVFNNIDYKTARDHYKLDDDEIVLFLRAQHEFKGTEYALEALKLLDTDKKITIITCDVVGMLDEVRDKYKIIDLGKVKYDEISYAMNACDMFLMPSKGESFGFMAVEAMSCGKPVVIFNNTALPSVTFAPECGYLVKDRDSVDLMKAIKYLINNPSEMKKRGNLGRKISEEKYSREIYNNSLTKMYLDIFKRKTISFKNKEDSSIVENKSITKIFDCIKKGNEIKNVIDIDYSNPAIQRYIEKMNTELYKSALNGLVYLTPIQRIKYILKKNKKIYAFLRKILKK